VTAFEAEVARESTASGVEDPVVQPDAALDPAIRFRAEDGVLLTSPPRVEARSISVGGADGLGGASG
jgi:hypothetical protein